MRPLQGRRRSGRTDSTRVPAGGAGGQAGPHRGPDGTEGDRELTGGEQRLVSALRREREACARLRELDSIKSAFLLAVSHDLRGPVTAMATLARMLADETALAPAQRRRAADSIIANAARVERVQRNLVDLDRLARHAVAIEPQRVDVSRLVGHTVAMADAADRTVSARIGVASAVLDPAVVERILDNLVSNAVNHTPPQTPVEVSVDAAEQGVLITVADHGPGVPPEQRRSVFKAFAAAVPANDGTPARGMGVGLHLVARFAALHGGRVWVEETPGGGASFRVLLAEQP